MAAPIQVLSVGTPILGNAVYHANLCASLSDSSTVKAVKRSVADYWDFRAKVLFATVASHRLGAKSYRHRAEWVMSEIARRGIRRELRTLKPDVIHCHTQGHALRCHDIARRTPLVVTMDATSRLLQQLHAYASQRGALEKIAAMEERIFQACALVGGVSRWVTESLEGDYRMPKEKVRLCSPCVDTGFFAPAPEQATRPHTAKLRVVFVGNDLERKGGRLLLELMAEGLASQCELHIVSGAEAPAAPQPGVTWHRGLKPRTPELLAQLQEADVFALPTHEDCFPQALVEAMSCGLPLIGTQVMGVPELVQDGVNGFCLKPGDKTALAEALRSLAGAADLRQRFAMASRRMACERFSFAVSRRTWEEAFLSASRSRPAHSAPKTR